MSNDTWGVAFWLRARFLLKGRPHPEGLTLYGFRACKRRSPHKIYFTAICRFKTKEEAQHAIRELKEGQK